MATVIERLIYDLLSSDARRSRSAERRSRSRSGSRRMSAEPSGGGDKCGEDVQKRDSHSRSHSPVGGDKVGEPHSRSASPAQKCSRSVTPQENGHDTAEDDYRG